MSSMGQVAMDIMLHLRYWHLIIQVTLIINSLAPGRFQFNFRQVIFKLVLVNGGWGISRETALRWMPLDLTDDESTLIQAMAWCCQFESWSTLAQVMAWCRQAPSHYLSQCWPRSLSLNGVTMPQWVNTSKSGQYGCHLVNNIFNCIFFKEKFE